MPQQCLKVFLEVERDYITLSVMAQDGEAISNVVNKALFAVFEEFIEHFRREVDLIIKKHPHLTQEDVSKLKNIVEGIITEFGARERRKYMGAAYKNREGLKINTSFRGIGDFVSKASTTVISVFADKELSRKMKVIQQATMLDLLEVCDQSLLGLNSLIDVFRSRIENIALPNFDEQRLVVKQDNDRYYWEERLKVSECVEEIKSTLCRRYLDHEIQLRLQANVENLFDSLRNSLNKLQSPEANIQAISSEFKEISNRYKLAQTFSAAPLSSTGQA